MLWVFFLFTCGCPPSSTLFPYTTLFRSIISGAPSRSGNVSVTTMPESGEPVRVSQASPEKTPRVATAWTSRAPRSEEHTSELQSPEHLLCRLQHEKKEQLQKLDAGQDRG